MALIYNPNFVKNNRAANKYIDTNVNPMAVHENTWI